VVGHRAHLGQVVGDEQDRGALPGDPVDQLVEAGAVLLGKEDGRLVEDEGAAAALATGGVGAVGQVPGGADDREHRPLGRRQGGDRTARVDVDFEGVEEPARATRFLAPVDHARARLAEPGDGEIFDDREFREEAQVLVDEGEPEFQRLVAA
jgi:hypothetical protein